MPPTGQIDLDALARRLATRVSGRTEANVQSDLHALLLAAPLELEEGDLTEIVLEQPAGSKRRIDVEAGLCVFEVKRDLRKGNVRAEAVDQLAGYVVSRTEAMGQRYVGVLTDGAEWHLFYLVGQELQPVSSFVLDETRPQLDSLCIWLEGVLATAQQIVPSPTEIERRLGALSTGYALEVAEIRKLYEHGKNTLGVRLKRELWSRLLTTALGTGFANHDELFVDHTLLVISAEIIAHAVMGLDLRAQDVSPATILRGDLFTQAQVGGVVDSDFFDWVLDVDGGEAFVRALTRRITRFAWRNVEHDVLKVLYESVISSSQRKSLGEYYTPDWLAKKVVEAVVDDPLQQRALDPACGSGTFLFHAVRRYLEAADQAGLDPATSLAGVTDHVYGMDIHPVAVTFARVTYLLAIGAERLRATDRPPLFVPVYLGDSIQWGQERTLFSDNSIVIQTTGSGELWGTELRFPVSVVSDVRRFDQLISEFANMAAGNRPRGSPIPSLTGLFRRYSVASADQMVLEASFETMCRLHDNGADHIWGYYVRNLARPFWLSQLQNRVDVLIGNPPWLSFRFMTGAMQAEFRSLSEERGLWAGASVATNQDLSALFVLRAVERYLGEGGTFAFVMPWATLRGRQFAGFRKGLFELRDQLPLALQFSPAWDLHQVKPAFFPVPACVVFGRRSTSDHEELPAAVESWRGRLPRPNLTWEEAAPFVERAVGTVIRAATVSSELRSPYHERFSQGASVVPRVLFVVEELPAGPLGAGVGRVPVRSRRSATEKKPWKFLPPLEASVDRQFVRSMHVGDTVLPYRALAPRRAVIPWDGRQIVTTPEQLALYPGFADWWTRAESAWIANRSSEKLSLLRQVDYQNKLSNQLPIAQGSTRVVYSKGGMYLAAAIVTDESIIDHKLYWATVGSLEEARYLVAILNSDEITARVRPLQARGEHNPRDFDKYVWQLPIPLYDAAEQSHRRLADLGAQAEQIAASIVIPAGTRFETLRRFVREAVREAPIGAAIEAEIRLLLGT